MKKVHYGSMSEFQQFLANNGFVPIKYKRCNCNGRQEYFINEECSIVHWLSPSKKAKQPYEVAWSIFTYNPEKSKNNANRHIVNIGFSAQLHRVVASTFLGNHTTEGQNDVVFIDGNYDNCHPSNLRWCAHSEAMKQYHNKKKES